jgi:hypothetical protein
MATTKKTQQQRHLQVRQLRLGMTIEGRSEEASAKEKQPQQQTRGETARAAATAVLSLSCGMTKIGNDKASATAATAASSVALRGLSGARVQAIAQRVSEEVEREDGEHDGEGREEDHMGRVEEVGAGVVEHGTPAR